MKRIGFVVAMGREMQVFFDRLHTQEEEKIVCGYSVYRYKFDNAELYLVDAGVGEISAGNATFMLINEFNVDEIVNFGVCGSLNNDLDIADIVFAKSVFHFDRDTSSLDDCEVGFYPEFGEKFLSTSEIMLKKALEIYNAPTVLIASSEKFVADKKLKSELASIGADVCEMESAGVVITCKRQNVPCLIVKAISDKADESAFMDFNRMLETVMAKCLDFIFKYLESVNN